MLKTPLLHLWYAADIICRILSTKADRSHDLIAHARQHHVSGFLRLVRLVEIDMEQVEFRHLKPMLFLQGIDGLLGVLVQVPDAFDVVPSHALHFLREAFESLWKDTVESGRREILHWSKGKTSSERTASWSG